MSHVSIIKLNIIPRARYISEKMSQTMGLWNRMKCCPWLLALHHGATDHNVETPWHHRPPLGSGHYSMACGFDVI